MFSCLVVTLECNGSCIRLRPDHNDHIRAYDFVQSWTHDGRPFRMLTLGDEYTRECLAIDLAMGGDDGALDDDTPLLTRNRRPCVCKRRGAECHRVGVRDGVVHEGGMIKQYIGRSEHDWAGSGYEPCVWEW